MSQQPVPSSDGAGPASAPVPLVGVESGSELCFRADFVALRRAFEVAACAGETRPIRLALTSGTLNLAAKDNHFRCESRLPLTEPCSVLAGQVLAFEVSAELFTDFLCEPTLQPGATIEFTILPARGLEEETELRLWEVKAAGLSIRWPFRHLGAEPLEALDNSADVGGEVHPVAIRQALRLVRPFARSSSSESPHGTVMVSGAQAYAYYAAARTVEDPDLAGANICVLHEHARKLERALKGFNRPGTLLSMSDTEQIFQDGLSRCAVPRGLELAPVEQRLKLDDPTVVRVSAATAQLQAAFTRVLAQVEGGTPSIRIKLEGGQRTELWVETDVKGGTARAACPVSPILIEGSSDTLATVEAEIDGQAFALALALTRPTYVEVRFLPSVVSLMEEDGARTVRTYLKRKRTE